MAIRYRFKLIDFHDSNHYPAFGRALPVSDRHASTLGIEKMKRAAITLGLVSMLLLIGYPLGLVGVRYPRIIENQPLQNPQPVAEMTGNRIELRDGRIFEIIDDYAGEKWPISDAAIHRQIDIERHFGDDGFILYGNRAGWICGTPWAQPIKIPIFRDDVYRNRREPIALAREITKNPKPNTAAQTTASPSSGL